ncbi:hypothetical protein Leryth_026645 [Lithospermum erythrorhizon]|nr:hypothetical protein Leryth_026645 [Lithospermum erythrorhizon]
MSLVPPLCLLLSFYFFSPSSTSSLPHEKYYEADVIKCKDGSKDFSKERLNDDFCDCPDGTDEPGTSACPTSKFYCRNFGSTPKFLFSSRVNDHICDCCDGSDEYDGLFHCPNNCVMGGNVVYQRINYVSNSNKQKIEQHQDPLQKLNGLKIATIIQACFVVVVLVIFLFRRRGKARRRHPRQT